MSDPTNDAQASNYFDKYDTVESGNYFDKYDGVESKEPTPFVSTLKSTGAHILNSLAGQPIEDIGAATGLPALQKAGESVRKYAENVQAKNPGTINTLGDIVSHPVDAAKTALGNVLPQLPLTMAGAYGGAELGAGIGSLIAPGPGTAVGAAIGGLAGAALPNYAQEYTEMRGKQHETGQEDIGKALTYAVPAAAAETAGDIFAPGINKLMPKGFVSKAFNGTLEEGASKLGFIGKQAVKGAAVEAGTEYPQTYLEQVGGNQDTSTPEAQNERNISAALGGLGGGIVSGGLSAVQGPLSRAASQSTTQATPQPPATQPLDLGDSPSVTPSTDSSTINPMPNWGEDEVINFADGSQSTATDIYTQQLAEHNDPIRAKQYVDDIIQANKNARSNSERPVTPNGAPSTTGMGAGTQSQSESPIKDSAETQAANAADIGRPGSITDGVKPFEPKFDADMAIVNGEQMPSIDLFNSILKTNGGNKESAEKRVNRFIKDGLKQKEIPNALPPAGIQGQAYSATTAGNKRAKTRDSQLGSDAGGGRTGLSNGGTGRDAVGASAKQEPNPDTGVVRDTLIPPITETNPVSAVPNFQPTDRINDGKDGGKGTPVMKIEDGYIDQNGDEYDPESYTIPFETKPKGKANEAKQTEANAQPETQEVPAYDAETDKLRVQVVEKTDKLVKLKRVQVKNDKGEWISAQEKTFNLPIKAFNAKYAKPIQTNEAGQISPTTDTAQSDMSAGLGAQPSQTPSVQAESPSQKEIPATDAPKTQPENDTTGGVSNVLPNPVQAQEAVSNVEEQVSGDVAGQNVVSNSQDEKPYSYESRKKRGELPWQMTQNKYSEFLSQNSPNKKLIDEKLKQGKASDAAYIQADDLSTKKLLMGNHKRDVENALSNDEPVPDNVLAEYPDLQAKYAKPKANNENQVKTVQPNKADINPTTQKDAPKPDVVGGQLPDKTGNTATQPVSDDGAVRATAKTLATGQLKKQKAKINRLKKLAKESPTLDEKVAAQQNVKNAESDLRKMRQSAFDIDDAIDAAMDSNDTDGIEKLKGLFPDAAKLVREHLLSKVNPSTTNPVVSQKANVVDDKLKVEPSKAEEAKKGWQTVGKNSRGESIQEYKGKRKVHPEGGKIAVENTKNNRDNNDRFVVVDDVQQNPEPIQNNATQDETVTPQSKEENSPVVQDGEETDSTKFKVGDTVTNDEGMTGVVDEITQHPEFGERAKVKYPDGKMSVRPVNEFTKADKEANVQQPEASTDNKQPEKVNVAKSQPAKEVNQAKTEKTDETAKNKQKDEKQDQSVDANQETPKKPSKDALGKGSTGVVYKEGDEAVKNLQGLEGEVYEKLKGVEGVANGYVKDGKVRLPVYKNIISVDTIPFDDRKQLAPLISKSVVRINNAISSLTNAGYLYNDPLQFGLNDDNKLDLIDFSNASKSSGRDLINGNLNFLSGFYKQFGLSRQSDAVSFVSDVILNQHHQVKFGTNALLGDEIDDVNYKDVTDRLDGKAATSAYYTTNARYVNIPNTAQTDNLGKEKIKVVLSVVPLSKKDISTWELTPVLVGKKQAYTPPENISDVLKQKAQKMYDAADDWANRKYKKSDLKYDAKDMYGQDAGQASVNNANERRRERTVNSYKKAGDAFKQFADILDRIGVDKAATIAKSTQEIVDIENEKWLDPDTKDIAYGTKQRSVLVHRLLLNIAKEDNKNTAEKIRDQITQYPDIANSIVDSILAIKTSNNDSVNDVASTDEDFFNFLTGQDQPTNTQAYTPPEKLVKFFEFAPKNSGKLKAGALDGMDNADRIQYVQDNFLDIILQLTDNKIVEANGC